MLMFQMTSPTTFINIIDITSKTDSSTYRFELDWGISHRSDEIIPPFKSVHDIRIDWNLKFLNNDKVMFFEFDSKITCVLLYKHDPDVHEKFLNMLITSCVWSQFEFERLKESSGISGILFPDPNIDIEKVTQVTDLLLASDAP